MKKALMFVFLLILSAEIVSQDTNFLPTTFSPNSQVLGVLPVVPEIRVLSAGLENSDDGSWFKAEIQAIFWAGLDESSNRIAFDATENKPVKFEQMQDEFTGSAHILIGLDNTPIQKLDFTVIGGSTTTTTVKFPLIQDAKRILPAGYRIVFEFQLNKQPEDVRKYIWMDYEEYVVKSGFELKRTNPEDSTVISQEAFVIVGGKNDGAYEFCWVDELKFTEKALDLIRNFDSYLAEKRKLTELSKTSKNKIVQKRIKRMLAELDIKIKDSMYFQPFKTEFTEKQLELSAKNKRIAEVLNSYDFTFRKKLDSLASDLRGFYTELWWTYNFCTPGWEPDKEYLAKIGFKSAEIVEKYKIVELLEGAGIPAKIGDWQRQKWLDRFEKVWKLRIKQLFDDFRKLFGVAMMDETATVEEAGFFGVKDSGERTFFEPLVKQHYEKLAQLFKDETLVKYIRAMSNRLAEMHTSANSDVDYPFTAEDSEKPAPAPETCETFYKNLIALRTEMRNVTRKKYTPPTK